MNITGFMAICNFEIRIFLVLGSFPIECVGVCRRIESSSVREWSETKCRLGGRRRGDENSLSKGNTMNDIKATIFAANSAKGRELANRLIHKLGSECPAGFKIHLEVIEDGDQEEMMFSGLRGDIVIFDASVEDDIGSNYKAAQMWTSCMEHFLVVSRTPLPLNFQAYHEGGSPNTSNHIFKIPIPS